MAILLVGGVMDLGVMLAVAGAITIERLAPRPRRAARAIGLVAVAAGAVALVRAAR
jgi:predicted metal-binding membrane protein